MRAVPRCSSSWPRARSRCAFGLRACALQACSAGPRASRRAKPTRIVSLDLCTDQLLIELVGRERIAAVTHLAADPAVSAIPAKAKGIPVTHGAAEDVLRHDPDLILAGPFGVSRHRRPAAAAEAQRRGRAAGPPTSTACAPRCARLLPPSARRRRARRWLPRSTGAWRASRRPSGGHCAAPTAVVYQIGGSVSGAGSLAEAALAAAGFRNMAADYRLTRGGQVPLELLVATPPDLLVLSSAADEYRTALADNLRHPALALLRQRHASLELPWQLWLCGTPHIADAVERLAEARAEIEARAR